MFHQKQKGAYCRCHAINNLVGRELVSLNEFNKFCDDFDKRNGFAPGSSKRGHLFYNNGKTDNIFGYIMERKKCKITMEHYDFYSAKKIKVNEKKTIGYIIYNRGHTYAVRIEKGERWLIDSLRAKPQKMESLAMIEKKGIGVICVNNK